MGKQERECESPDRNLPFTSIETGVINNVLGKISANPKMALQAGADEICENSPSLNEFIFIRQATLRDLHLSRDYIEGAIWMYLLLKAQVESRKSTLPVISREMIIPFLQDLITNTNPQDSILEGMEENFLKMKDIEGNITFFTNEICKYKVEPEVLKGAMAEIYFLCIKAARTHELNNLFNTA